MELLAPLAAKPVPIWSVPSEGDLKQSGPSEEIHLSWINDNELIALRRGGILGKYDSLAQKTIWQKSMTMTRGFATSNKAIFVMKDQNETTGLLEISLQDGHTIRRWTTERLQKLSGDQSLHPHGILWLAAPGILAIESLQYGDSSCWMFNPAKESFGGKVQLGGYLWNAQSAGNSLTWEVKGVIFRALAADPKAEKVWDSGLGAGGDDYPCIHAYCGGGDGSFVAVLDNGGWQGGMRIFRREQPNGKVSMTSVAADLHSVAIDWSHQRIWGNGGDPVALQVFDFSGRLLAEMKKGAPEHCWAIAISPSGTRIALLDQKGRILIVEDR
ncbi:MAG: hypothetical protein WCO57_14735 [Verrucomicrobiota bacterium]